MDWLPSMPWFALTPACRSAIGLGPLRGGCGCAGYAGLVGRVDWLGDAVNPSMEARERHPWRSRPQPTHPPGHGHVPARPPRKINRKERKADRFARKAEAASALLWLLLLLLPFSLDLPWWRPRETVRGRVGRRGGGVRGMDAAAKPPGMGSRRPPTRLPTRPTPVIEQPNPTTEGLRRSSIPRRRRAFRAGKKFPTDLSIPVPPVRRTR